MFLEPLATIIGEKLGLSKDEIIGSFSRPKTIDHGDFAFPCFAYAKKAGKNPQVFATELLASLGKLPDSISKAEVAGGYLNFFADKKLFAEDVISKATTPPKAKHKKKIVIDYSGPNIAKPFHAGHLRTTLIGLSLYRTFKDLGHDVTGVNHLGDWGSQFGYVYAGVALWGKPKSSDMEDLLERYRQASTLRKAQEEDKVSQEDADKPNVTEMARAYFLRLEAGDKEAYAFWKNCLDISMDYYIKTYTRLGITFDYYTGESFYSDKLAATLEYLKGKGILENSRGALGVELGEKLGFARLFTEDGRSLYASRDVATAIYRYETFKPDHIYYVVDARQSLHFSQLKAIMEKAAHPVAPAIKHIGYGMLPGIGSRIAAEGAEEKDQSSLRALLDEAKALSKAAYESAVTKRPEGVDVEQLSDSVGIGAIYFNFLSISNNKTFHFSWDEALNFQGDTGPYLQYALARIKSIISRARAINLSPALLSPDALEDKKSHELYSLLSRFDSAVEKTEEELEPYHIANITIQIARAFSAAYQDLKVIGEPPEIASTRLSLLDATSKVLARGMTLLGVPVLEKM